MAASAFIEVLILETEAGEIPAIRATCRTPLPAASSRLARCALVAEIGGLRFGFVGGGLQIQDDGDDDGELKQRKSHDAADRSREQPEHTHCRSPTWLRLFVILPWLTIPRGPFWLSAASC